MPNMEFLKSNFVNTTTVVDVNSGTATVGFLFDRKTATKFKGTAATLTMNFTFNTGTSIDRIVLEDINFKQFSIVASGANITLTNALTTTSSWSANSETSLYLYFSSITAATVTLNVVSVTAAGNQELAQIWISEKLHELDRNPAAKDLKQKKDRKEYIHKLSGGGTAQYVLDDFYDARFGIEFVPSTEVVSLRSVYDEKKQIVFAPFPTGTNWGNKIFEVIWTGDFDFEQRADNDASVGFNGSVRLVETAK